MAERLAPNLTVEPLHHEYDATRDGRFVMIRGATNAQTPLVMVFNCFDELRNKK